MRAIISSRRVSVIRRAPQQLRGEKLEKKGEFFEQKAEKLNKKWKKVKKSEKMIRFCVVFCKKLHRVDTAGRGGFKKAKTIRESYSNVKIGNF